MPGGIFTPDRPSVRSSGGVAHDLAVQRIGDIASRGRERPRHRGAARQSGGVDIGKVGDSLRANRPIRKNVT
jgi:hypothetical protein